MIRLLQFLFQGCFHEWEDTTQATWSDDFGQKGPIVYCRCKKCGRHISFKNGVMKK